ncbi:MAG: NUDIX hydrolase [Betaproteobacteria bacterium]
MSARADRRPALLRWAQRVQAIAQTGLTYARDPFDRQRYEELREIAIEMAAAAGADALAARVAFTTEDAYPTPKVDVRAVVFRGDELLLVREARTGGWTFPGGWADVGDTPGGVAERETREESGYAVRARKMVAVFDKSRHEHPPSLYYTYKMLVLCELLGGEARESHETNGVGFFSREALPDLDLERATPGQLAVAFAHHADPARPTDFD